MLEMIVGGFATVFTFKSIILISIGVFLGLIFGSIPGLTATMAIAICLPITFGMLPEEGFALLMGLYIGGISGGLIPAILLKIPGTPSSIATTFDGHPMAQKGLAGSAFGWGITSSFIGGTFSIIVLMFLSPILAGYAIKFGPFEYFAVIVFALTLISSLSGDSLIKGVLSGLLGITFAFVGAVSMDPSPRFTFGFESFSAGFDLLPVLIGLFAVSEVLLIAESKFKAKSNAKQNYKIKGLGFTLKEFIGQKWNLLRSSIIGTAIGILPGIGGGTANIVSYVAAKNTSKHPEKFGTGIPDGVVASEAANNAAIGGALVPLIAIGIPGDTVTAMLLGGLVMHGLEPGPLLFTNHGNLVYGIFASLLIANIIMVMFMYSGMKGFVKLLSIPQHILIPIIMALCIVGAFGVNNRIFDVGSLVFFGILGYLMVKSKYPLTPFILGFILGPILEINLRRGLILTKGDFLPFITQPIAATFLALAVLSIIFTIVKEMKNSKNARLG